MKVPNIVAYEAAFPIQDGDSFKVGLMACEKKTDAWSLVKGEMHADSSSERLALAKQGLLSANIRCIVVFRARN
jgi:hypothetical protein